MSIASVGLTVVLVAIAIVLAVARFRAHIRMRNSTKRVEHSQRRLGTSLETLSEVMESVQSQGSLIMSAIVKSQIEYVYNYPGLTNNLTCPNCRRWAQWQTPATVTGDQATYVSHMQVRAMGDLVHYDNPSALPSGFRHSYHDDWLEEWIQTNPESKESMAN